MTVEKKALILEMRMLFLNTHLKVGKSKYVDWSMLTLLKQFFDSIKYILSHLQVDMGFRHWPFLSYSLHRAFAIHEFCERLKFECKEVVSSGILKQAGQSGMLLNTPILQAYTLWGVV